MDAQQISTKITPQQMAWVDFCATNGMSVNEDGEPVKLSAEKLAKQLGVDRKTLYNWRDSIDNFWELVNERRNQIYSRSRMSRVYNAMFAKAVKGDVAAASLLMKQAGLLRADKAEVSYSIDIDGALD